MMRSTRDTERKKRITRSNSTSTDFVALGDGHAMHSPRKKSINRNNKNSPKGKKKRKQAFPDTGNRPTRRSKNKSSDDDYVYQESDEESSDNSPVDKNDNSPVDKKNKIDDGRVVDDQSHASHSMARKKTNTMVNQNEKRGEGSTKATEPEDLFTVGMKNPATKTGGINPNDRAPTSPAQEEEPSLKQVLANMPELHNNEESDALRRQEGGASVVTEVVDALDSNVLPLLSPFSPRDQTALSGEGTEKQRTTNNGAETILVPESDRDGTTTISPLRQQNEAAVPRSLDAPDKTEAKNGIGDSTNNEKSTLTRNTNDGPTEVPEPKQIIAERTDPNDPVSVGHGEETDTSEAAKKKSDENDFTPTDVPPPIGPFLPTGGPRQIVEQDIQGQTRNETAANNVVPGSEVGSPALRPQQDDLNGDGGDDNGTLRGNHNIDGGGDGGSDHEDTGDPENAAGHNNGTGDDDADNTLVLEVITNLDGTKHNSIKAFFVAFAKASVVKRPCRITNKNGVAQNAARCPSAPFKRMVAALCVEFSYLCGDHISGIKTLSDLRSVWCEENQEKTKHFVSDLNEAYPFLVGKETAEAFVTTFNYGLSMNYYKNKFKKPLANPTGWWKDGHLFATTETLGLHVSLKPFFEKLEIHFHTGS